MRMGARLARWFGREDGTVTVEFVLLAPLLMWAFAATFVFFDGYRSSASNIRTSYTIGDALSRETEFITPTYLDSMFELQQFLNQTDDVRRLRITVFRYREAQDDHRVIWSQVRGSGIVPLTNANLADSRDRIPTMSDQARFIMVETWTEYETAFNGIMDPVTLYSLSVTRPRFAGQLCYRAANNSTPIC
jgi:hypothetical protein